MNDLWKHTSPLGRRVLDCFPSGSYSLSALLRVMDVVETREVETAAVECRVQPRLLMNPDFVATSAATPEKLLMLVMHELHHVLLGHTRLFPRATKVDNLVFDAVINALLCRMFPAAEHTAFFTDYYAFDQFPQCLLRPPHGWTPQRRTSLPPPLRLPGFRPLAEVYRALYSPKGAGYHELYDALRQLISEALAAGVKLLGDHRPNGSAEGLLDVRSPVLFEIVREIVERWPQPPDPIAGRSLANLLRSKKVDIGRVASNRCVLRRLIRHVAGLTGDGDHLRRRNKEFSNILTPIPAFDRRSIVLSSLGSPVLLHQGSLKAPRQTRSGDRVHVYLDVSGSIGSFKASLYGAVLDCRELVYRQVHLFSTLVADLSLRQLREGSCQTTDGTSIGCVAEHLRNHRVKRAVILTDGYVGRPRGEDARTLDRTILGVGLIPGNSTRSDLETVADYWTQLK